MDSAVLGFVGVLVGAVVGAAASILTTIISNRNARRLQIEADEFLRLERARTFQRETLIEAQSMLQEYVRLLGRAHLEDSKAYRSSGTWRKGLLSDEVNERLWQVGVKLSATQVRIADDSVRSAIGRIHTQGVILEFSSSMEESEKLLGEISGMFQHTNEQLGQVLRANY